MTTPDQDPNQELSTELSTELTAGWPATPDQKRMDQTVATLAMMEATARLTVHSIMIPARMPEHGRPRDIIEVETPDGRKFDFDAFHERRIDIPDQIIMKDWKVRNAQSLHDSWQAANFSQACARLFNEIQPHGPDETGWVIHTTAKLGDSTYTIGIAIQRPIPDRPGKNATVITKVPRDEHWMGYNTNLQNLRGLTFRIIGAMDVPDLPSYVVGCPSDRNYGGPPATRVKPNTKTEIGMLAKILKHHGADECLWIPYENVERYELSQS